MNLITALGKVKKFYKLSMCPTHVFSYKTFFKIERANSRRYYEVSVMASLKPRERRLH